MSIPKSCSNACYHRSFSSLSLLSYPCMSRCPTIPNLHPSLNVTYIIISAAGPYHLYILWTNFNNFYHTILPPKSRYLSFVFGISWCSQVLQCQLILTCWTQCWAIDMGIFLH